VDRLDNGNGERILRVDRRHADIQAVGPRSRGVTEYAWRPSHKFQSLELPAPVTRTGFALDHKCALWGG
jgi:hypothetical protein